MHQTLWLVAFLLNDMLNADAKFHQEMDFVTKISIFEKTIALPKMDRFCSNFARWYNIQTKSGPRDQKMTFN